MSFKDFPAEIRRSIRLTALWTAFVLLAVNPFNLDRFGFIGNQEFFAYHTRDVLGISSESAVSGSDLYLATGTYEQDLEGDLFGIAKGRNLIVIQIESLQNSMIGAKYNGSEVTPALNALIEGDSIYFDNFYQQLGSGNTSDAEFAMNNSMLGAIESYTYDLYQNNYFRGLPWILKQQGYSTLVLHGYHKDFWNRENAYPNQGFDKFIGGDDFKNDYLVGIGNVQGVSDKEFFRQSIPFLKESKKPFYSFYITLSSHHPFNLPEKLKEIELKPEDQGTLFGDYINAVRYADSSIGEFLALLKENGLYDDSMIVIYGDHYALSEADEEVKASVSNYLGYDYDISEMMSVPLIINIPGKDVRHTVGISGGETDIMPTVAYLLGIDKLDTLYFGQNLLTAESGFVPEQTHLLKGSFIKDDIVFEMSRDGVFENSRAWDRFTKEPVDIGPLREYYLKAKNQVDLSQYYLRHDVLRKVLLEGKTLAEIAAGDRETIPKPTEIVRLERDASDSAFNYRDMMDLAIAQGSSYIMVSTGTDHRNGGMPYKELGRWMERNPSAYVLADSRNELIPTLKSLRIEFPDVTDRIIPVVRHLDDYTMSEYAGYSNIMLMPDLDSTTLPQTSEFLALNDVWAAALPKDMVAGAYNDILKGGSFIFACDVSDPAVRSFYKLAGVDGFIKSQTRRIDADDVL